MTKVSQALYDEYKALTDQLAKALDNRDEIAVTQINAEITAWALANKVDLTQGVVVDIITPTDDLGYIKPGGWGANTDASKWKVVNMKNPPEEFKVVDENGVNVIVNFKTEEGAQAYIDTHKLPPCPQGQHRDGSGNCVPDVPLPPGGNDANGQLMIYPTKTGGRFVTKNEVRYFTRHYASGKPDDPTVEMTINADTAFEDQECTCIVQMTGMNHVDTIDWKMRGGVHSSSNPTAGTCYDLELNTDGSASKTLEVESPHPHNHPAHQPQLFQPGNMASARFGWKGITINTKDGKGVHIESWINLTPDDQKGWKKYIDVTDTGQLYKPTSPILKCYGPLATIRIDGIKGKPTFSAISMREITWA